MADSRAKQGQYKGSLENLIVPERKTYLKKRKGCGGEAFQSDTAASLKELSITKDGIT